MKFKHEIVTTTLWHKDRLYSVCIPEAHPEWTVILDGAKKTITGPSLVIPGQQVFYEKFECPKCLEVYNFPDKHGTKIMYKKCYAVWSFWGAGVIHLENEGINYVNRKNNQSPF